MKKINEAIALVESDGMENWYTIELKEHDGRHWMKQTDPNSFSLMYSGRISDADVEGTAEDMLEIAKAIRSRKSFSAKRCSVNYSEAEDGFYFSSPRNSREDALVPSEFCDVLAEDIFNRLEAEIKKERKGK